MKATNNKLQLTFSALAGLCLAAGLVGQEARTVIELDPFEVQSELEPGNIAMDSLQIERLQPNDLSELFSNQSTLAVGGGSSVAQKIYVRGFEDTLLNVTVDGAQQIGELYHHQARLQLEPEFIKTIELDAGAGAATNGAGALTGAMTVVTKDAFDMLEAGKNVGGYIKGSYGFNGGDNSKAVASAFGKVTEDIGLIATYSYSDGDDYEDGNGNTATPTAYTQERGYLKLSGKGEAQNWSLAYENLHDFGTYYERPHMTGFRDTYVLSDHDMNRETLTLNHNYDLDDERLDLSSTLYWTNSDYSNFRNTTGALYGEGELESIGFDIRNSMVFHENGLTFGFDFRQDSLESAQQATPPPYWGASEQTAQVFGLYAQDEWKANDVLSFSAGLRFDSYAHDVDSGVGAGASNDDTGLSPNASVSWDVSENLTLRAGYSKAFRGITIREAFFSAIYTHDGTLESEDADNIEIGFAWEKDGFFARGTVYEQTIENYINAEYVGGDVWGYWRNMGDADVEGYEFEMGKHWAQAFLSFGVWDAKNTFNDAALTDADLGLGTNIGRTWTAKANYYLDKQDIDFGLLARYVEDEENSISDTAPDKESYFVTDLFVKWQVGENDNIVLSAALRNVFNEFYYDHATYGYNAGADSYIGFPAKGRELSFSATYKF